ncbi:hypothetical protein A3B45_05060 [Candidatus Daviesbacteria bacterium RIFCSPLOWO2_01_FULL_39_12]|uniref:Amidohydrolase-related domain-containing protein n=1 Tax=Candidatus Daviesbacteria bacterium RIFCSPLOWO2_01_FULL_39_12 TaxID=1797785 RepID=A0A1F5KUK7_9BACT|nr:MAG: hypothetical protein A3D79_01755 [Candidatus Daviesbacteria bacterium RIFCSPHIGHO2_02_FULL_39_8]OGE44490.1 MAG: hypothetical protein A3B45_05060 [Candidatus Daviesbacteria bacterium RIFCSPLOWO2_01_FULL_39_12]
MAQIVKIVAILIFIVVFIAAAYFITVRIFKGIVGGITEQQTENVTEKKPCNISKREREFKSEPYYSGPLIDSHVHFPTSSKIVSSIAKQNGLEMPVLEGNLSADNLICLFESERITKTFAFHITSKFAENASVSTAKAIEEAYPEKLVHFIMPPPIKSLNVDPSGIGNILNSNKGLFKGFGEVALYMDGYEGTKPDDPDLKEIYKLADEHNLIVMIHPEDNLKDGVEEILQEFPNVTFFFHGGRDQEWLIDLMPKYKNFYYSVDGDLVSLYGYGGGRQFHKATGKGEYLSYIRENFDTNLNEALRRWKGRIEKYPDRFTWGTDRWYEWHFDPEVGGLIEEFSRSFIGSLEPAIQENFAYKNAERMLREK